MLTITETTARKRQAPRMVFPKIGRPYLSTSYREYDSKPRLYVSLEGENIMENFANRFDRPAKLYRTLLPTILQRLGLPADTKANWSQKAGCSCGCSPGFILTIPVTQRHNGTRRVVNHIDFWATIENTPEAAVKDNPDNDRRGYRAEVIGQIVDGSEFGTAAGKSGRSPRGNLRNFGSMRDAKLRDLAGLLLAEDNDPEAIAAVQAELKARV